MGNRVSGGERMDVRVLDGAVHRYIMKAPNYEVDAWGISRALSVTPLAAEWALNRLVESGKICRMGSWYGVNKCL